VVTMLPERYRESDGDSHVSAIFRQPKRGFRGYRGHDGLAYLKGDIRLCGFWGVLHGELSPSAALTVGIARNAVRPSTLTFAHASTFARPLIDDRYPSGAVSQA
jgi:hypothetical protein